MPFDRARTLSLYRQLLKVSKQMPSRTRQEHLVARVRDEFRRNVRATTGDYELLVAAGESHLETLQIQHCHLTALQSANVLIPVDLDTPQQGTRGSRGRVPARFMRGPTPSWLRGKEEGDGVGKPR